MSNETLSVGQKVTAAYKSGQYIGEIVELTSAKKAAVQILAVLRHPAQGDLHQPMDPDVAFFHQRRALSYREIALMPLDTIKPYHGEIPDYQESLRQALEAEMQFLRKTEQWVKKALHELEQLSKEYFPG
jgi:kinase-associated protein B